MLYKVSPLKNLRGIGEYIFEDLGIDEKDFLRLDMNKLLEISQLYNTQNHRLLDSMIRKIRGKNEQIYPHKSR